MPPKCNFMNKSYAEVRPPYHTPWGHAQTHDRNGAGLWFVSTAGHGGLYMSPERLAHFKSIFPTFEGYAGLPWLEEDCDYCLGVLAFADDYEAEAVFYAWDMVMTYQSDNTFYFAEGRAWLLSDAGAAVRLKAETYSASRAGLWRRGGCGTQGIGWHTNSIRGHKRVCRYESRKRSQLLYCASLGENLSDCQGQTSQNRTSGSLPLTITDRKSTRLNSSHLG